ncbi:MAG: ABC transporter ATP-binding protein [Candidatus Nomurabacteria bacterium]|nr:MAG: ABC transporter ATP-binding protein [Candidatus Nomurabacteria bacterium]
MEIFFRALKQYKKIAISALVLAAINQVFSLLDPQIFRILVDRYASRPEEYSSPDFFRGAFLWALGIIGVAFISLVARSFQDYYVNVISQRVSTNLYAQSVGYAFALPFAVFEDQRSGELLQKMQKAKTDIEKVIRSFVNVVFLSVIGMLFVLVYAFFVHWLVGLVYTLIIPTIAFSVLTLSRRIKKAQSAIVTETAALSGSTTETLRNVELVKSLGLEEQEVSRLNQVNDRILDLELKKVRLVRALSFVQGTLLNALRSGLILLMLWLIYQGNISIGEFLSLFIYSFFVFQPLTELGTVITDFQEARASSEKLQEILAMPEAPKPEQPVSLNALQSIIFDNVVFQYQSNSVSSVEHIHAEVHSGETIAFVGPSGSGKTTLMKLVLGLYQPSQGQLRYNDIPGSAIQIDELRKKIGFVGQETQLFAGTIRENLQFVQPEADEVTCLEALKKAAAMNIIERGKQGLDTKIGEGGLKLSGGERQRLAIARALLRNPELLIFDEATSSLDSLTEKEITQTIQELGKENNQRMTLLIAHRLSTVAHADRIYVLEKGKIVEQGKHEELVQAGGLYAALWRQQSGATE